MDTRATPLTRPHGIYYTYIGFLYCIGAWAAVIGVIWFLFEKLEHSLSEEARNAISKWLRQVDLTEPSLTWPVTFAAVFDRVFGQHHLSFCCFALSVLASITSAIIFTALWAALRPIEAQLFFEEGGSFFLFFILLSALFVNVVPDYVSLLETRVIIRWMSNSYSKFRICALLILDSVLTLLIFWGYFSAVSIIFQVIFGNPSSDPYMWVGSLLDEIESAFLLTDAPYEGDISLGIFLYTTYITSVWIWLYLLSGLTIKALNVI